LTGELRAAPAGSVPVYASEAAADLYGLAPGTLVALPLASSAGARRFFVAGVWRDYARQHGAIAIDIDDYRALTGDASVSDAALWFDAGATPATRIDAVRAALSDVAGLELRGTG